MYSYRLLIQSVNAKHSPKFILVLFLDLLLIAVGIVSAVHRVQIEVPPPCS
jgi:hypothetical protein